VTAAGFDQLFAQFNANAWSGRLEGGYRFVSPLIGGIGITPYAAAQFVIFELPAYAEQAVVGTNNFALTYAAKTATDARSELGLRIDKPWLVDDGVFTLRGRFAWARDYDPSRSVAATFQTLPGTSFVINGAAQAADSALATASVEMKWRNGWSAAATFDGEFSAVTASYAGKAMVRYAW
jgi:outer membrane autotransporter protein